MYWLVFRVVWVRKCQKSNFLTFVGPSVTVFTESFPKFWRLWAIRTLFFSMFEKFTKMSRLGIQRSIELTQDSQTTHMWLIEFTVWLRCINPSEVRIYSFSKFFGHISWVFCGPGGFFCNFFKNRQRKSFFWPLVFRIHSSSSENVWILTFSNWNYMEKESIHYKIWLYGKKRM